MDARIATTGPGPDGRGARVIAWILARRRAILIGSLLIAVAGGVAASRLPIKADFSALLPPSTPSVKQLEAIQQRVRAFGTAFVLVESRDPAVRSQASQEIRQAIEAQGRELVTRVNADDGPLRRFVWANRHLFADKADLERARSALADRIKAAKLKANPLYIDLDDEPDEKDDKAENDEKEEGGEKPAAAAASVQELDDLRAKLDEAEAKARSPAPFVSTNGDLQLLIVQAAFPSSKAESTRALAGHLQRIASEAERRHPGVRVGLTGDIMTTLSEQRSILVGMLQAAGVTILLVLLLLVVAYRSLPGIASVLWALAVGTLATLGLTKLFIGHFNIATAFLSAIVIGNGINPGLILLSRFREELERGDRDGAVARAMAGAARGSLTASLTAAIAYASLAVTDFRGFRHFGIIGGIGMSLCWVAAFTVLPAALATFHARRPIHFRRSSDRMLHFVRRLPRNPVVAAALGLALTAAAGLGAYHYLAGEPLEKDWRKLRSDSAEILEQRAWNDRISNEFTQGFNKNLSGRFAIVLPRRDQVAPLVEVLRARDRDMPPARKMLSEVRSMDDIVPRDQPAKLAILADIRRMIDKDLRDELEGDPTGVPPDAPGSGSRQAVRWRDPTGVPPDAPGSGSRQAVRWRDDGAAIERVRPPDDLRPIGDRDVPEELAWPFIERDGTVGKIVIASKSDRFDSWNVTDLVEFSGEVRAVPMPEGTLLGGQAFVFADMLASMQHDGPRATLLSLVGSMLMILLLLGFGRHGWITIVAMVAGTAGMIALAGVAGIKVNFLDFIALPITIGIGADYAANIAARERSEPGTDLTQVLLSSGGAVVLCSLTTIIGYGSLLVSDNAGIRSFGTAAILGEVTCLGAALLLCPALLGLFRRRREPAHSPPP